MRSPRIVPGLMAALLLGLVLIEPRFDPIRAQSEEPSAPPPAPVEPDETGPPVTTELHAGLWRVDGGFVSTIRIKNSLVVAPLEVTPILYMADGTAYTLPPVPLAVAGVATVNVNEALAGAPAEIAEHISPFGSAALRYTYPSSGHVLGSIEVLDIPRSLIFTYPFSGRAETEPGMQTIEGVWWRHEPEVGGFVSLANTTAATVTDTVQILGSGGTTLLPQSVELPPRGTVLLDLDSLAGGLPGLENQAGGIRVQYEGRPGDVIVEGGLLDESVGYSAKIPFEPRGHHAGEATQMTLASVGVMAGEPEPAAGYPGGTRFIPYVVLRNTTSTRLNVKALVNFMAGSQPTTRTLPDLRLRPFETRRLNFEELIEKLGLSQMVMINVAATFEGHPGDLVLATGSTDQSGTYVFAVEPRMLGPSLSQVGTYWKAADGFDTVVMLWNPTDQSQDFLVTLYFGEEEGHYKVPVGLAAKASATVAVSPLIAEQRPDEDGNVIPLGTREGSVTFSSAKGMTEPMTLAATIGILNVKTATCGTECRFCCGYGAPSVKPNPDFNVLVGQSVQLSAKAIYCTGSEHDFTGQSDWSSKYTSIATVGNSLTTKGKVTGQAAGKSPITAKFPLLNVTGTFCLQSGGCPSATFKAGSEAKVGYGCNDERDFIIQEYVDFGVQLMPICSSFTQTARSVYFRFDEFNTGHYSWALLRRPMTVAASSGYGMDRWREAYGSSRIINSGYRNPAKNADVPGSSTQSQHMYGTAADLRNQSGTQAEWNAMVAAAQAANADFIEPSTGPCQLACTHADWRSHDPGIYSQ